MVRGRKKRREKSEGRADGPKAGFAYKPFAELKVAVPRRPPRAPEPVVEEPVEAAPPPASDEDAFAALAAGTIPLTGAVPLAPKRIEPRPAPLPPDDAALVMRELDELVHGARPFDFADTEEFVEAAVRGFDNRVLRRLRRGDFSVQGHLDLHGMRREEARQRVAEFVVKSHAEGKRCVLIVHGRGLGSKDNIPVLKEKLQAWLTRGAIGRHVLAFTSARPWDGGTGAVYVLLRS
ncbi:MAG: Smr/MutS family protein [Proteobacteria bacterium]|jgi:DNA-nicking Smr family endonuclease|nr:Smr/MutS family protein [Pseudomonadota bacterium]